MIRHSIGMHLHKNIRSVRILTRIFLEICLSASQRHKRYYILSSNFVEWTKKFYGETHKKSFMKTFFSI